MIPVFSIVRNNISPTVRRFAETMKRSVPDVVRRAARGITRRVIDITPPASEGVTGAAAYRAGKMKIARQMNAVMAPVRLKGRRRITTVFGRRVRRPIYVQTREKYPDVATAYRAETKIAASGFGVRVKQRRQKLYVDVRKFDAVLKERQDKVGTLAAGFSAAANALDVPLQQWISRQGTSGGRVQIDIVGARARVVVENFGGKAPGAIRGEVARRIGYAVEYQRNAMEREIAAVADKAKRENGIKSA